MDWPFFGELAGVPLPGIVAAIVVLALALMFFGVPLWLWTAVAAASLYALGAATWIWITFTVLAVLFNVIPIRRLLSSALMKAMEALQFLPAISDTEQEAIDAGTVWVEGELFSGKPDFKRMLDQKYADLTDEERAFLDGPAQQLCEMTDDWAVFQRRGLSDEAWEFIKREKFFGMIIPKEYGGLGFGPAANSAVVAKAATCSTVLGITVMVPNSLGPAELLVHYGTEAQKTRFLPRLADGRDIPAFALTETEAGSDAGAIEASGVVFERDGQLYLRLNWRKRYITLAAVSTVLGLAFRMYDPDNLLGKGTSLGITCGLVPTEVPGVVLGKRHDPMGIPFYNCPTEGHDVELPLEETVIGGSESAGKGWRMLMESLSAGRGISLPATSTGGIKHFGRVASAHSVVRRQFGLSIGKFEGIEEPLARIGGFAYLMEAARRYTNGAIQTGAKPAVVTAIAKYNFTELARRGVNDAMDILGGNAISRGPRNLLANAYINTPISITVEGANILTRTLMIFGQGAIRCHPYALIEIKALQARDVKAFDRAFWAHVGHVGRNKARALLLSLSRGRLASSPVSGPTAKYYKRIAWASASFAFLADIAMGSLGGELKRREKLTGRFADIFSWMYLCAATLRRWEAEGRRPEDLLFVEWSLEYGLHQMQVAFDGIYKNIRVPLVTWLFRGPIAAWSRMNPLSNGPSDRAGHAVATAIQTPGEQRERLFAGSYVSTDAEHGVARLERAMRAVFEAAPAEKKLRRAIRRREVPSGPIEDSISAAVEQGILTSDEGASLLIAEQLRADVIEVDEFTLEEYKRSAVDDSEIVNLHG